MIFHLLLLSSIAGNSQCYTLRNTFVKQKYQMVIKFKLLSEFNGFSKF